jgi:serine/threonine-protein kinase
VERVVTQRIDGLVGVLLDGRYRVGAVLARGGMSTVYRGVDLRLDRPVAIKVMASGFAGDPAFLQRFEREARAAARLHHPGVVGVFDQGIDRSPTGDRVFLVMELVSGGTLRDLLAEHGALPVPLALSVAEPVLSALAAAHRAGLVHRDVKPENVLIGPGGVVKVADFGLVRAIAEAGTTTGDVILGTVAYLSPEQVATGTADPRSDVYSAGVLLYELLTGRPPYTGDTALSVAYRHVNDDVPPPSSVLPDLPARLDELVVRATRRDPAVRPEDASAFLLALRRVRGELDIPRVSVPVPATSPAAASMAAGEVGPRGTRAITRFDLPAAAPTRAPVPRRNEDDYRRQRSRSRRAFRAWLAVVLLLAGAVGIAAWWLGAGRWTSVPSVTGLDRAAAEALLTEADLDAEIVEDHSDSVPLARVIGTDPATGERAIRGTDVGLVVSLGPPVVPDVPAGSSVEDAERIVTDADLRPVTDPAAAEFSDTVAEGDVAGLRPAPGTVLTVGAPVTLVVSKGLAPTTVPDVRTLTEADATAALAEAGLSVSRVERRFDGDVPGGRAIGTKPPAGEDLLRGTEVTLLVSTALVVPDVTGRTVAEARQILSDTGLRARVQQFFGDESSRVIFQSPGAGSVAEPDSAVRLITP